jgi:hypothetical protein
MGAVASAASLIELLRTEAAALLHMQAERDIWDARHRPRPFKVEPLAEAHA